MLDDVGNARGVFGRGAEGDAEALVFVAVDDGKHLGAGGGVLPETDGAADFGALAFSDKDEGRIVHAKVLDAVRRLK